MKQKLTCILTAMLLLLAVASQAYALDITGYVTDDAAILTTAERESLEKQAADISRRYDFGVYIITVDDYRAYTSGDVLDATMAIYTDSSLGHGEGREGLVLLLSMEDRDYGLVTHGEYGNYAFDREGREAMTDYFLDDFRQDDWYDGFSDYLSWSAEYLETAQNGHPYTDGYLPEPLPESIVSGEISVPLVLLAPPVIALVVLFVLNGKMKSVAMAAQASAYVVGELALTDSRDQYTHTTQTRVRIENRSSGSGSSRSSGSFSGTRGKF